MIDTMSNITGNGKIDPASVAFDVDGVITDTMGLFLSIVSQDYGINGVRHEDITRYLLVDCLKSIEEPIINTTLDRIQAGDYSLPLNPLEGATDVLTKLCRRYRPILLVTARSQPGPLPAWLADHLPLSADAIELVTTGTYKAKADVLLKKGIRYFVDDRLDTCFALEEVGIEPVLFKQPWNRQPHRFREVGTWRELESLMDL